nr:protoporphyrinogen oxidase, mitochondrial [Ipomoea batatas]
MRPSHYRCQCHPPQPHPRPPQPLPATAALVAASHRRLSRYQPFHLHYALCKELGKDELQLSSRVLELSSSHRENSLDNWLLSYASSHRKHSAEESFDAVVMTAPLFDVKNMKITKKGTPFLLDFLPESDSLMFDSLRTLQLMVLSVMTLKANNVALMALNYLVLFCTIFQMQWDSYSSIDHSRLIILV